MDNYKPSKSSQTAIEKMMAKWRDDDQKLEMEERDRAKRSMIMKKKGLILLSTEDSRVGVQPMAEPPPLPEEPEEIDSLPEQKMERKEGEGEGERKGPYVDPSLYDEGVIHRTKPHGLTKKSSKQLIIRPMEEDELSMAFAWMFQDEQDYPENPNQWWTRARKGFMVGYEDGEDRLTGAFIEGIAFPVAFAITKTDHRLEIDAIGVRRCMRGLGIASIYVQHYLDLAEARQHLEDGDDWYEVEAVQNAIGFWRKMGFEDIPKDELPSYRTKNKTCLMMRRPLWDVAAEAEAERIAAEKKAIAEADS